MKLTNYFPHDYNARNDAKLIRLRMDMGLQGIGIYWCIVEMLYEEDGKIERSNLKAVAYAINEEVTNVQQVIEQYNLFEFDDKFIWSEAVSKRLKNIKKISSVRSSAGKASAEARKGKALQNTDTQEDKDGNKCSTNVQQMFNKNKTFVEGVLNNKNKINIKEKEKKDNSNNTSLDANASLSSCDDAEVAKVDTGEYISYKDEKVDIAKFTTFWNNRVEGSQVPKIVCIKGQRRTMLEARLKQFGKRALFEAVDKLGHSDFLRGMTTDNGWHATFDWLVGPRNFVKVLEGNYDNKTVSYGNDKSNQKTVREREQEKRLDGYAEVIQKLLDESDRECVDIDEVREE